MTAKRNSRPRLTLFIGFITFIAVSAILPLGFEATRADASPQAVLSAQKSKGEKASADTVQLPEHVDAKKIDEYMAALSDEQVRRLLIEALRKQAAEEAMTSKPVEKTGRLVAFINGVKELMEKVKERIAFLRSGATAAPSQIPSIFTYLGSGEKATHPERTIFSVVSVFAAAFAVVLLFRFLTTVARKRFESSAGSQFISKIGASAGLALLSIAGMVLFVGATLTGLYVFLDRTTAQRVLVAAYLVAILIVWAVSVVSKFLLAPKGEYRRLLPISDEAAVYLHRWIVAIATVGSFGTLTCGIIRLAGASQAAHFKSLLLVGIVMAGMLIWMIAGRRKQVAALLSENLPPNSFRAGLAQRWHIFAGLGVILLLVFVTLENLLQDTPRFLGIKTLLMIPLYLLLDLALRQILDVSFGLAQRPDDLKGAIDGAGIGNVAERVEYEDDLSIPEDKGFGGGSRTQPSGLSTDAEPDTEGTRESVKVVAVPETDADATEEKKNELSRHVNLQRLQRVIRIGLRSALAAWMAFWLLSIWGINLPIGEHVAEAAFNILVVAIIGYVVWEVMSAAIQRRLKQEIPDDDEEREEGGVGGSRIGTLLLILRKFILVVIVIMVTLITLSSIGIDIAPLIAGAGVVGLAIGFGAQTLVKDIISGVFFLIDDAIRVGDYVDTGKQKGTVEHISLRALRLRHPRGMVYTIPFSDISSVTNFSRDYIITKLDFRIPFDTDLEKVRKLVKKKVYNKILADEKLASKLLGKIKSQGVRELDDSAMIIRVKYKTPPGEQFVIRKEVYRLMQEAFQEAGLRFAHRNVTVSLPPEVQQSLVNADAATREKVMESVAAAAGAAIQAEDEQKAAKAKK